MHEREVLGLLDETERLLREDMLEIIDNGQNRLTLQCLLYALANVSRAYDAVVDVKKGVK